MDAMPNYKNILVIINPKAGQRRTSRVQSLVEEYLRERGIDYTVRATQQAGDALRWARAARAEGFDLVAVAGGDGTIREAVEGLMRSGARVPLAQIPAGTSNVTARALRIPIDIRKSLLLIDQGREVMFDLGYMPEHDRYFVFVAGAGYDAHIIHDTPRELKKTLGFFAYIAAGVKHFFKVRPVRVELETDGHVMHIKAHTIMVINIGSIEDLKLAFAPNIDPHDGKLNVMVISTNSLWSSFVVLVKVLTRRYFGFEPLQHYKVERIRVQTEVPLPMEIDGDPVGSTPFLAEVIPNALPFVVPDQYDAN